MSGHGSSGRWHFPVNAFMEQVFARSSFSAPASFSYCSVGFHAGWEKSCFRQCVFLLRTQWLFNHCFQFRRHLLQRLFRGFGQKSGLRRLMPRRFFLLVEKGAFIRPGSGPG